MPRSVDGLIKEGRWLSAGESLKARLAKSPDDAQAGKLLKELEGAVARDAENISFDPKRYFYAQAYLDYFKRERYADAVEAMEQVLVYELENEEILLFMDKAQVHVDAELERTRKELQEQMGKIPGLFEAERHQEVITVCRKVLSIEADNAEAERWMTRANEQLASLMARRRVLGRKKTEAVAAAPAALEPAPDAEWIETRYRHALKSYVGGNVPRAIALIEDLVKLDPMNARLGKALQRMKQEAPDR